MMKEWIAEYNPQNEEETLAAMREIMQEIALAALSRTDFYKKAVEMFSRNQTKSINAKISLKQKLIYKKANKKIRKIIQQSEKELLRIQNKRKIEAIKSICEKYQVKENTITRLL